MTDQNENNKSQDQKPINGKNKGKEEGIIMHGTVTKAERGRFRVEIDGSGHEVIAVIAGKLRKFTIKIVPGDRVKVEVSPYDINKGRIVYREK